jgi:hypothetical protein
MRNEEVTETLHDMEQECDFSRQSRLQTAISQMLHEQAFELARIDPESENIPRLLTCLEKLSALDYKRKKLQFEHRKMLQASQPELRPSIKHHRVDLNIVRPEQPVTVTPPEEHRFVATAVPANEKLLVEPRT